MVLTFAPISSYYPVLMRTSWEAGLLAAALAITVILFLVACASFVFLLGKPALAGALSDLYPQAIVS